MKHKKRFSCITFIFVSILLLTQPMYATHLRAGDIIVTRESCTGLTFLITIIAFTNTTSEVRFGEGILDFGDGETITTPNLENTIDILLGPEIGLVRYQVRHTYAGPGRYTVSYLEPNRNEGILNMLNSVETRFYIETIIDLDPFLGCNNTPDLLVPPIDGGCTGVAWTHNPGASDTEDDSLSYELISPKRNKDLFVFDYRLPNARPFYDAIGIDYGTANEKKNASPIFKMDPISGTLTWDAPGMTGEYNIAFLVKEWRKIADNWILLGSVTRDMQIVIEDCDNERPELEVPKDICVEAGTIIREQIFGTDVDGDDVKIEAFFALLDNSNRVSFSPASSQFQPTRPNRAVKNFEWRTHCDDVKSQPYQIVFKITDNPSEGISLVSFQTWNITVVASAPILNNVQPLVTTNTNLLDWESYTCGNAEIMQVWRREGISDYTHDDCVVGMPPTLGYEKIAEVGINVSDYTDTNNDEEFIPGSTYCYRLVAVFPEPRGGESYVSEERCITLPAYIPLLTKVSVDFTSLTEGEVSVEWIPPLDVVPSMNPAPYTYELYRIDASQRETKLHSAKLSQLAFVDRLLNTKENIYTYFVIAYDANDKQIGRSLPASTVWLNTSARFEEIQLEWTADVPWSNSVFDYPWHLVYRGEDAIETNLSLIDSSNVVAKGNPIYIDVGQYNNIPLSSMGTYCYRVMTRGSYSNPKVSEPLINFSQIVCAKPNDEEPPCSPVMAVQKVPCSQYVEKTPCFSSIYSNMLTWERPQDMSCRNDIDSYNVYVSERRHGDFNLYRTEIRDTLYHDRNLPSFSRCYKISAVDRAGNESELSDSFCFDTCPQYELPNVFTPNGDACNQSYSAYGNGTQLNDGQCGTISELEWRTKCARFVQKIDFSLYNRWGKSIYNYESGGEQSIYIDWNGIDNNGKEVSSGIYYYHVDILFDRLDEEKKIEKRKGWLQIIR